MTTQTLNYRFKVRGGTKANLTAVNEIPLDRELVIETDTGKMKLGNGSTPWNTLPYISTGGTGTWLTGTTTPASSLGSDGDMYLQSITGDVYRKASGTWSVVANIRGPQGNPGTNGTNGRNPEYQFSATHLQYRLIGDSTWLDLYPISALQGPPGEDGADGQDAPSITRTSLVISSPLGTTVADVASTFKMMRLFRCEGDFPFRLRLYSTIAERDADFARVRGTDAAIGSGLLFEFIGVAGLLGANLSPVPVAYNNETPPVSQIAFILEADSPNPTNVTLSVMEIQP